MNIFIWCGWFFLYSLLYSFLYFLFTEKKDEREDRITDISQLYQIFPDEVLGSGQFGIVYGGKSVSSYYFSIILSYKVL